MSGPAGGWGLTTWSAWLNNARFAVNLVTMAASLALARVLWVVAPPGGGVSTRRSSRGLRPLALLIALCGVSYLAVVLAGQTPAPAVSTAMRVLAAALCVAAALRFRPADALLMRPPPVCHGSCRPPAEVRAGADDCGGCAPAGLAAKTERLRVKARALENLIANDISLLGKDDILRELREVIAELESQPCQT